MGRGGHSMVHRGLGVGVSGKRHERIGPGAGKARTATIWHVRLSTVALKWGATMGIGSDQAAFQTAEAIVYGGSGGAVDSDDMVHVSGVVFGRAVSGPGCGRAISTEERLQRGDVRRRRVHPQRAQSGDNPLVLEEAEVAKPRGGS